MDTYDALKVVDYLIKNNNGTYSKVDVDVEQIDFYCNRNFDRFGYNQEFYVETINLLAYNYDDPSFCNQKVFSQKIEKKSIILTFSSFIFKGVLINWTKWSKRIDNWW